MNKTGLGDADTDTLKSWITWVAGLLYSFQQDYQVLDSNPVTTHNGHVTIIPMRKRFEDAAGVVANAINDPNSNTQSVMAELADKLDNVQAVFADLPQKATWIGAHLDELSQKRAALDACNAALTACNAALTAANAQINDPNTGIAALQAKNTALQAQINTLRQQVGATNGGADIDQLITAVKNKLASYPPDQRAVAQQKFNALCDAISTTPKQPAGTYISLPAAAIMGVVALGLGGAAGWIGKGYVISKKRMKAAEETAGALEEHEDEEEE